MKTNIVNTASGKANVSALFFVKKSVQFSNVLSENAEKQVESVAEAFLKDYYGNPSSLHTPGQFAKAELEKAREVVAKSGDSFYF